MVQTSFRTILIIILPRHGQLHPRRCHRLRAGKPVVEGAGGARLLGPMFRTDPIVRPKDVHVLRRGQVCIRLRQYRIVITHQPTQSSTNDVPDALTDTDDVSWRTLPDNIERIALPRALQRPCQANTVRLCTLVVESNDARVHELDPHLPQPLEKRYLILQPLQERRLTQDQREILIAADLIGTGVEHFPELGRTVTARMPGVSG